MPPLFVSKGQGLTKAGTFSFAPVFQFLMALILQVQFTRNIKNAVKNESKNTLIFKTAFWWSITLGTLMLIFVFMQILTYFWGNDELSKNVLPSTNSVFSWIFIIFSVATAAFYEEIIYRQFMPEILKIIFFEKNKKKWISILIDFISLLIFAFSHRYLGWIAILNAFICGFILRLCYTKTNSIWTGAAAHFSYNMTLILFGIFLLK